MMARMPLMAAAAAGGCHRLIDLWATAPTVRNWQEPLGQDDIPSWSSWSHETKIKVLVGASLVFLIVCCCVHCLFCRKKDTSRFAIGPWSIRNDDDNGVNAPPPWLLPEQQPLPESRDGHGPRSNDGERDRSPRCWQQPPTVAEVPTTDVEMAVGDMHLTQAGMDWMIANMELLAPAANVDMAPAADAEVTPTPEPALTLKCTFSTADGWAPMMCTVCLSGLVNGETVWVLTACMHCFHATCIETWLGLNSTCPICRAPAKAVLARGRRRRRTPGPNLNLA